MYDFSDLSSPFHGYGITEITSPSSNLKGGETMKERGEALFVAGLFLFWFAMQFVF